MVFKNSIYRFKSNSNSDTLFELEIVRCHNYVTNIDLALYKIFAIIFSETLAVLVGHLPLY